MQLAAYGEPELVTGNRCRSPDMLGCPSDVQAVIAWNMVKERPGSWVFDTDSDGEYRKKKDRKSGSLSGSESNAFLYANLWYMQLKNCQLF